MHTYLATNFLDKSNFKNPGAPGLLANVYYVTTWLLFKKSVIQF